MCTTDITACGLLLQCIGPEYLPINQPNTVRNDRQYQPTTKTSLASLRRLRMIHCVAVGSAVPSDDGHHTRVNDVLWMVLELRLVRPLLLLLLVLVPVLVGPVLLTGELAL